MEKRNLFAITAVGLAAAIAVPTIAFGNARNNTGGSLHVLHVAQTPFVAQMTGANEVPAVTTTATGAATFTFDILDAAVADTGAQVCWDMTYSGIVGTPTLAHIHRGAAGASGSPVVPATGSLTGLGATSATGCELMDPTLAQEIMTTPAGFYVNVHSIAHGTGEIRGQLAAGPAPAGEAHLLPQPLRAYDSRTVDGPIALNATRTISLATGLDSANATVLALPPGATGAIVTLTLTDTSIANGPGGFLKLYSAVLTTPPTTSSINWTGAGQNLAVTTQVAVDATGQVKVTDGANPTNFVVDVIGYLF